MYSTRTASHKYQETVQTLDMPFRKKIILYLALLLLVLLWFIGVKNRDPQQYDNLRRTLELYEYQLKESKEQVAETMRLLGRRDCVTFDPDLPVIFAITPTFARPVQKAELTRLSHTLMLVQNLHWIVVEDSDHKTELVTNLLADTHINYTHLYQPTPPEWKHKPKEPNWVKPRGVLQRNHALSWLRANLNPDTDRGVVYFADDDNSYSLQVFIEMRFTKEVSVWPVGLVGGLLVEKPVVNQTTGRVIGWNSQWRPERPFPIDMAGFAINLQHLLRHPEVKFLLQVRGGWQESELLTHLTTRDRLEPLAEGCTKSKNMASKSRRGQQIVDDPSMDVDQSDVYSDKHQLMLQYLMHARMAKKSELVKVHNELFNDDEQLSDTLSKISSKIKFLKMDIKQVKHELTGETHYVIFHSTGEFFFPKCCIMNKSQLEFLKQVLTGIVLSTDGRIGRIQALNSCQGLSKSDADETIELFIKDKILIETKDGRLCLSPLAVVEFEPFFNACFSDNLSICDLCKQRVFVAEVCEGCNLKFHAHCIFKWLGSNQSNCPKCKQVWPIDMDADTE